MKRGTFAGAFYQHIRLASVLIMLLMTASIFLLTLGYGRYHYITYTTQAWEHSGLENAVYVMPPLTTFDPPNEEQQVKAMDAIQAYPGVKAMLYQRTTPPFTYPASHQEGNIVTIRLLSPATIEALPLALQSGKLFSESGLQPDGTLQGLLASPVFDNVQTGQDFELLYANKEPVKVHAVGKLRYPYFYPTFETSSNYPSADDLFASTQILLVKETPETMVVLSKLKDMYFLTNSNFIIDFAPTATEAQRTACLEKVNEQYMNVGYADILKRSQEAILETIQQQLFFPVFLFFLTTMAFFSLMILTVYRKGSQSSIWYLVGCSKRRAFWYMFTYIAPLGVLPIMLNMLFVCLFPVMGDQILPGFTQIMIGPENVLGNLLYLVLVLAVSFLVPYLMQRRLSPIETLRRMDR